jgi:hypothetical protein
MALLLLNDKSQPLHVHCTAVGSALTWSPSPVRADPSRARRPGRRPGALWFPVVTWNKIWFNSLNRRCLFLMKLLVLVTPCNCHQIPSLKRLAKVWTMWHNESWSVAARHWLAGSSSSLTCHWRSDANFSGVTGIPVTVAAAACGRPALPGGRVGSGRCPLFEFRYAALIEGWWTEWCYSGLWIQNCMTIRSLTSR